VTEQLVIVLFRPVGQAELNLIRDSGWKRFPPRLEFQPIFYPVLTEDYAIRIARDWNTKDPNSGRVGYVLRFSVRRSYLERHQPHEAGGRDLLEYWIPAEELDEFNDNIVGTIEAIHEFHPVAERERRTMMDPRLRQQIDSHPYPLVFATISGAHLYGFPSPDSDYDLRGVHLLPLEDVIGLNPGEETVERSGIHDGLEIDLVTHDARKFFALMLKKNGYVLEQLLSPLVVQTTPEHEELKVIAIDCITRHHAHHYLGFAETQWKLFLKADPPHVKPLLYVYRVLLTGLHLMRAGQVESNLVRLNETAKLPYIGELIERKTNGPEKGRLEQADVEFHHREYERLRADLELAMNQSTLPETPKGAAALNNLLIRLRLSRPTG